MIFPGLLRRQSETKQEEGIGPGELSENGNPLLSQGMRNEFSKETGFRFDPARPVKPAATGSALEQRLSKMQP